MAMSYTNNAKHWEYILNGTGMYKRPMSSKKFFEYERQRKQREFDVWEEEQHEKRKHIKQVKYQIITKNTIMQIIYVEKSRKLLEHWKNYLTEFEYKYLLNLV